MDKTIKVSVETWKKISNASIEYNLKNGDITNILTTFIGSKEFKEKVAKWGK